MSVLSTVSPSRLSEQDLLAFILTRAASHRQAAAMWRLPDSDITHVLISDTTTEIDNDEFLEELDPGFLAAPFDRSSKRIFLKADYLFTFSGGQLQSDQREESVNGMRWLNENLASYSKTRYTPPAYGKTLPEDQDIESFMAMVNHAVAEIANGNFLKVVPSRTRTVALPADFDVVEVFQKLCGAYTNALISFISVPGAGNWLGASPEILVSVKDKKIFKTVALAGTLPYAPGTDLRTVAWTQKEIEEQALVERYVISCFKRVRLREYDEQGPRTVVAGNLMHLKSEFTVDMKATNFPQIGTVMLGLLHPTSAVCGMPLDMAQKFLHEHEPYDRGFFAGYLGPVNIHNDIDLFVNLRCMQIAGKHGTLYAGAGVTIDSIPEKEWAETEIKFNTLLNILL